MKKGLVITIVAASAVVVILLGMLISPKVAVLTLAGAIVLGLMVLGTIFLYILIAPEPAGPTTYDSRIDPK